VVAGFAFVPLILGKCYECKGTERSIDKDVIYGRIIYSHRNWELCIGASLCITIDVPIAPAFCDTPVLGCHRMSVRVLNVALSLFTAPDHLLVACCHRNFAEGLRVLRGAKRFDLTHNFCAERDPTYATALAALCDIDADASLAPVLNNITPYDTSDRHYQFGPFVDRESAFSRPQN
jgi:hypothetical protein